MLCVGAANNGVVMNETPAPTETKPRYTWPWFVAALVLAAVVITVLSVRREAQRVQQQQELLQRFPGTNN